MPGRIATEMSWIRIAPRLWVVAAVVADERAEQPDERDARGDLQEEALAVRALHARGEPADRDPDARGDPRQAGDDHGGVVPAAAAAAPEEIGAHRGRE